MRITVSSLTASFVVVIALAGGCQSVPGDACEQSGDGFNNQDTCRAFGADGRCLSFPITCPDGSETTPNVCEGAECAVDDDCEADWVCAGTGSVTRNCVPASVCE